MYPYVPSGRRQALPVEKKPLQISEADARIRTADPFITSDSGALEKACKLPIHGVRELA